MKLAPRFTKSLNRWLVSGEPALLALWVVACIALEMCGRSYSNEWVDFLGLSLLCLLIATTVRRHRVRPVPPLTWLAIKGRAFTRWFAGFFVICGVDFRLDPPLPSLSPPGWRGALAICSGLTTLFLLRSEWFPVVARESIIQISYVLYLAVWGSLVTFCLVGSLICLIVPIAMIHDAMVTRFTGQGSRPKRLEFMLMGAFVMALFLAAWILPLWTPLLLLGLMPLGLMAVLMLPRRPQLTLVWRPRGGTDMFAFDYRWYLVGALAVFGLFATFIATLTAGESIVGATQNAELPLTSALGRLFAWSACGAMGSLIALLMKSLVIGWQMSRRRYGRPSLYVQGADTPALKRWVRGCFRDWSIRFDPKPPLPTDIPIVLGEQPFNQDIAESWPLPVAAPDLESEALLECLQRRDHVQKRRLLMRGLKTLFKRVARRKFKQGDGFWIALQHWYSLGLTRDSSEEELDVEEGSLLEEIVGPPFYRVFSPGVRRYFGEMMNTLEVDLIFTADGVGYRRMKRVFQRLFEIYDQFDRDHVEGERVEDRHFLGITGVKVLIHEIPLDRRFENSDYPEPDYEDIGRGRIMHVFRDSQGSDETVEPPTDIEDIPLPSLAGPW